MSLHPVSSRARTLLETAPTESLIALVYAAREAATHAYAPFSRFHVGSAVVMADDPKQKHYVGTNVENSSYGLTICAERSALVSAVSLGFRRLKWIAVSCAASHASTEASEVPLQDRSPCGACRQVIQEFATAETLILLDRGQNKVTADAVDIEWLLPAGFKFTQPE